ncbi:DUF3943 domain-containing protein [Flavisolibacter nicotianae]|uniref:DUF3943 domain-containing protein n=1 Tax=Flavisolibacter nicotianae TaxID=2364882 RepID=UPI0013C4AB43|nr:DUF3943 domain-containing protein [Flavisolibacter nicotianae]
MLANVLPFSIDYFIRRESFSFISWQSIGENLHLSSWEWDRDKFLNNQFSHPYHGSYYFNAFRSEGYGFWQASTATFGGSLLWELVGEVEKPAINDLINTTLGGMAWGEMTHRLAMRLTHNWRTGRRKNALDVLGIAVDPMNGFSTLTSKKRQLAQWHVFDTTTIKFELSGGSRQYNRAEDHERKETRGEWFTRLNFVYGAPNASVTIPFAYFAVLLELGTSDSTVFNIARIRGNLTGWNLRQTDLRSHSLLLLLNSDYYNNTAFSYGLQSLQLSLHSRFQLPLKSSLQTETGLSLIGLAAISDQDLFKGKKRNYDYGNGAGLAGMANLFFFNRIGLRSNFSVGWLHTLDGKNADYRVLNSITALRCQVLKKVFAEYEWGHFLLKSLYPNNTTEKKHNYYKRVSLGYQFRF